MSICLGRLDIDRCTEKREESTYTGGEENRKFGYENV